MYSTRTSWVIVLHFARFATCIARVAGVRKQVWRCPLKPNRGLFSEIALYLKKSLAG
jgi:hypothetical protein